MKNLIRVALIIWMYRVGKNLVNIKFCIVLLEVNFKPNSILHNRLVRWCLYSFINYWKTFSLVDVRFPTPFTHIITQVAKNIA